MAADTYEPTQDDLYPANMAREIHLLKQRLDLLESPQAPANPESKAPKKPDAQSA